MNEEACAQQERPTVPGIDPPVALFEGVQAVPAIPTVLPQWPKKN